MPLARLNLDTLFCEAIAISDADARVAFIKRASEGNPQLLQHLEKLVVAHFQAGDFLQQPVQSVEATAPTASSEPAVTAAATQIAGSTIGPYKIRELLGEGGMGSVYVAEQERPVRRKVALKVIKPGMDSRAVIARFEAERQALSLMDHPHIAKVLDAGTTDQGHPYFVMELVKGLPITEHCDTHHLAVSERLELFIQICRAVQHAHQKAVIHRDLKPSNILVAMHDTTPVVKVIDFGVAKAIGSQLTDSTLYTGFNQFVGTPLYMSPEQAGQSSLDIDTRSDIYSLGVLLYELLVGITPLDGPTMKKVGLDEMRRMICEVDPPRLSARISTLKAVDVSTIAERRHVEPRSLIRTLRGDLDWIVMKAMEKDRTRRYESVSGLQKDIERYLDNEPVLARPPSVAYRLRKYAKRHKGLLSTATILLVMLVAATVVSAQFAIQTHRAALDAIAARIDANAEMEDAIAARKLTDKMLAQSRVDLDLALQSLDTIVGNVTTAEFAQLPGATKIRNQMLEQAMQFYSEITKGHNNDPYARQQQAEAHGEIGIIHGLLGNHESALNELNQSIGMIEQLMDENPDETKYWWSLGRPLFHRMNSPLRTPQERLADAEWSLRLNRQSLELGVNNAERYQPLALYKVAEILPKGTPRAESLIDESLNFSHTHGVPVAPPVHVWLGQRALAADDVDRAIQHYSEAIEGFRRMSTDPEQREPYINRWAADLSLRELGRLYEKAGKLEEAEHAYREAFEDSLKNYADYQSVVAVEDGVGQVSAELIYFLKRQGRLDEANRILETTIEQLSQRALDDADSHIRRGYLLLGLPLDDRYSQDRYSQLAVADFEQALQLDPENMGALYGLYRLHMFKISPRDSDACLSLAKRMLDASPNDWRGWWALSHFYLAYDRLDEADAAVNRWLECNGNDEAALVSRAEILEKRGDLEGALRVVDQLLQNNPLAKEGWVKRGELNSRLGDWQAAADDFRKAIHLKGNTAHWHKRLARASFHTGDYATALTSLQTAFRLNPDDLSTLIWIAPNELAACPDETLRSGILELADQAVDRGDAAPTVERGDTAPTVERGDTAPRAHLHRAQIRIAFGMHEEAIADIQSARQNREADDGGTGQLPAEVGSLNNLAWALATAPDPKWPDLALELATEATRLAPKDGSFLNTLGVAQYRAGNWPAAIEALEESMARSTQDLFAFNGFFLVMARWQTGDTDKAREYYERSVESMAKHHQDDDAELKRFRAEAEALISSAANAE